MKILEEDILNMESGIVCHQVNCMNAFGAGLAGQIAKKWPQAKTEYHLHLPKNLGDICCTYIIHNSLPKIAVVNCFSQYNYGNSRKTGVRYTDYDAVEKCFIKVRERWATDGGEPEVFVPWYYGCGLAGGEWHMVSSIITDVMPNVTYVRRQQDKHVIHMRNM